MIMKFKLLLISLFAGIFSLAAQTDIREAIKANPDIAGSIYSSYHCDATAEEPAPKGYKPFYISHYGRHGSRWHSRDSLYVVTLKYFEDAAAADALTDLGRDVYGRMKVLYADAAGRAGQLSPKGVAEHRGIAERMYRNYPEVFASSPKRRCRIEARSTLVPRCLMSMTSFCERLKELDPSIEINREIGKRYLPFMFSVKNMNAVRPASQADADRWIDGHIRTDRFISSLFKADYAASLRNPKFLMRNMYRMSCITQDVDYLGLSFHDLFTEEELFSLWSGYNVQSYLTYGPSAKYGDAMMADAAALLKHIIGDADEVIASGGRAAFLRFGHDVNVVPLVSLLGVEGKCARVTNDNLENLHEYWCDTYITPMATNVQFVFYRNKSGEVIVKVLHNEGVCRLPFDTDIFPYYRWDDFRKYYMMKMSE